MTNKQIIIDSFNPYESKFKNRKVVNKDTLILIKTLRNEGYNVLVKPDNASPVEYIFQKGDILSFLQNPLNMLIISFPISLITNILSSYIWKKIEDRGKKNSKYADNIILIDTSNKKIVNSLNTIININSIEKKKKEKRKIILSFQKCFETKSPYANLPYPIFLQHKPIIVGWCSIEIDEKGLKSDNIIITDEKVLSKIKKGIYKGCSITGIAKNLLCNICNSDYMTCNHIAGNIYDNIECYNSIQDADFIEASIVKEPINPQALLRFL